MTDAKRITADQIKRKTAQEIRELAADIVQRKVFVTNDPDAIRCAFYVILAFISFTKAAVPKVGALIGDMSETLDRSMNGYPIFTTVGFLHVEDLEALNVEVDRMYAALGVER